ncbi:MAG: RNA polymerase sigma factor, partial [Acidobacteriota bacterium]
RDSFRSDRQRRRREETSRSVSPASQHDLYQADSSVPELLAVLPARQREVATLYYVDDRSVAEIAAILEIDEGTVKSHLSTARERLRAVIDRDEAQA